MNLQAPPIASGSSSVYPIAPPEYHSIPRLPSINIPIEPDHVQLRNLQSYASSIGLPPSPEPLPQAPSVRTTNDETWRNIVGIAHNPQPNIPPIAANFTDTNPLESAHGGRQPTPYGDPSATHRPTANRFDPVTDVTGTGQTLRRRSSSVSRRRRSSVGRIQSRLDELNDEEARLLREMEELERGSDEEYSDEEWEPEE